MELANGESFFHGATLSSFVSMSPCILRVPKEAAGWWDDLLHCVGSRGDIYDIICGTEEDPGVTDTDTDTVTDTDTQPVVSQGEYKCERMMMFY